MTWNIPLRFFSFLHNGWFFGYPVLFHECIAHNGPSNQYPVCTWDKIMCLRNNGISGQISQIIPFNTLWPSIIFMVGFPEPNKIFLFNNPQFLKQKPQVKCMLQKLNCFLYGSCSNFLIFLKRLLFCLHFFFYLLRTFSKVKGMTFSTSFLLYFIKWRCFHFKLK